MATPQEDNIFFRMLCLTRLILKTAVRTESRYTAPYQLLKILCTSRENHSTQKYFINRIKMELKMFQSCKTVIAVSQFSEYAMKMTLKIIETAVSQCFASGTAYLSFVIACWFILQNNCAFL